MLLKKYLLLIWFLFEASAYAAGFFVFYRSYDFLKKDKFIYQLFVLFAASAYAAGTSFWIKYMLNIFVFNKCVRRKYLFVFDQSFFGAKMHFCYLC